MTQVGDARSRKVEDFLKLITPDLFDLDSEGERLCRIVENGTIFRLQGEELVAFVRRALHALIKAGGVPVRKDLVDGYRRWVVDTKYGSDPDAIVEGTIADWLARGIDELDWGQFRFNSLENLAKQAIPTLWGERRRAWQPGEDPNEPRHRTCDAPMSRWIAMTAADPHVTGLSSIVADGIEGFGLSGAALDDFVRRSVGALVDAGWRLTASDHRDGGGGRLIVDPRYGEDRGKIVEAVMAEWRRRGKGRLNADVQVLTQPEDIGTIPWYARR